MMIRKLLSASAAVACTVGLVGLAGTGVAAAHGGPPAGHGTPPAPVTATGTTTCNFHGMLAASSTGTVSLRGNLTRHKHTPACSSQGASKLRTGHVSGLASSTTITGLCSLVSGGTLPDLAGGTINWAPRHHVTSSTGVALTGGSVSVVTVNGDTFLQVAYTGGSVAGGSFMNASGASFTATSRQDTKKLAARCAEGSVSGIALNGSITL